MTTYVTVYVTKYVTVYVTVCVTTYVIVYVIVYVTVTHLSAAVVQDFVPSYEVFEPQHQSWQEGLVLESRELTELSYLCSQQRLSDGGGVRE